MSRTSTNYAELTSTPLRNDQIQVLHVEDNDQFVDLTSTVFEDKYSQFTIETAATPAEGLELLDNSVDCIVSDYQMPGMDGIEFLETVREHFPDIPFILFTGEGSEEIASDAISAGVTDYLQKESGIEQFTILANRVTNLVTQNQAETGFKRRSEQLETVLSNLPLIVSAVDADGTFTLSQGRGLARLGLSRGEVVGESVFDVYADNDKILSAVERALTGEEVTAECEIGDAIFEATFQPVCDTNGDAETVIIVAIDITDRIERERELEISQEALDNAHVPITLSDPSQEDNPMVYINERFEEVTGYDKSEALGENCRFLQGEETDAQQVAKLRDAINAKEPRTVELRNHRKDGTMFWNEVSVRPIYHDGELVRYFGSQKDITEQKRFEQRLRRQNDRLGKFARVVSHDLQNPLQVAHGNIQLAQETCNCTELETTTEAIERCQTLIDDLLTVAQEGARVSDAEPIELQEVTRKCWKNIKTAEATLTVHSDGRLKADQSRFRQLLENLLANAVEHSSGDVHIRVGWLPKETGVYIADDGAGIPPGKREVVLESGYSTSENGTGFGLAIVQEIAQGHGWEVTVTDSKTGGARFEITGIECAV